eukprot:CAMPEP_0184494558 /NCGR_PEP_ID=MMETSP0113_2-20130426/29023_1 /TAXON_ID=91329 /ORGANISM="Norrisiella sphaerica, Strain BC52" /LENGTH=115 /DNA_ID=CAMNT_0026880363 /DNA_START=66 /DNA_END=411 /DNA_ORIENTATION=+
MTYYTSDLTLLQLFSPIGEVLEIKFMEEPKGGGSLGKAILWFRDKRHQNNALRLNGTVVDGQKILVSLPSSQAWARMIKEFKFHSKKRSDYYARKNVGYNFEIEIGTLDDDQTDI